MTSLLKNPLVLVRVSLTLLVVLFLFNLTGSIENIPNADDFDVFLDWANHFLLAQSLESKAKLFLLPHNEHLVLANRLFAAFSLKVFGAISFSAMLITSNLLLVAVFFLCLKHVKREHVLISAAMGMIFFQPQFAEICTWATPGVAISSMLFWSIAALMLVERGWFGQILALCCAILATVSFAAGFSVFLAIAITFILRWEKRAFVLWTILSALAIAWIMSFAVSTPKLVAELSGESLAEMCKFALLALGSAAGFSSFQGSVTAGTILTALFIALSTMRYFRENRFLYSVYMFLIFCVTFIAYGRYMTGIDTAFNTSRYKIFSTLLLMIACYITFDIASRYQRKNSQTILLSTLTFLSFIYFTGSYSMFGSEMKFRAPLLRDSMLRWELNKSGLMFPTPLRAEQIMHRSVQLGTYQPAPMIAQRKTAEVVELPGKVQKAKIFSSVEHTIVSPPYLLVDGYAFVSHDSAADSRVWIQIISDSLNKTYEAQRRLRLDVERHFSQHGEYFNRTESGFSLFISCEDLPDDSYRLRVIVENDNQYFSRGLSNLPSLNCNPTNS